MQTRHRIPTIFNLSMVDVLCCALGCVILLWLINFREAKRRAAAAGQTASQLKATRAELAALRKQHQAALALAKSEAAGLAETIRSLEAQNAAAAAGLRLKAKELAAAGLARAALEKEVAARKAKLVTLNSKVEDLSGRLLASQDLIRRLRKTEGDLRREARDYRDKLAAVDARALALAKEGEKSRGALSAADRRVLALLADKAALERKLTASTREADRRLVDLLAEKALLEQRLSTRERDLSGVRHSLADLEADTKSLREQVRLARAAAANRFAGIELTGKKVIFLIDVSGSMKMRDENTLSPTKWPTVCHTVGKLMRSLPDITHYQVILFSKSVRYLHGSAGDWLPYDPKTSPGRTVAALRRVNPRNGTKMAPAFAEAFRFRAQGLDTIYLFSDGLPNDDDEMPAEVAALAEGPRTAWLSNRVRQRLKTVWNRPGPGRPSVRINAVGFFFDSPEVGAFLWALAREHGGGFVGMSRP
jgi:hypothetical protein